MTRHALQSHDRAASTDAFELATRAIALDPNAPSVNAGAAEVYLALGESVSALKAAGWALALYPESRYDELARRAAEQTDDLNGAITVLNDLLQSTESTGLRIVLAKVALRAGNIALAQESARRVLQADPANAEARAVLKATGG
jgi:Flp pilus assembly protein TadD